VKKNIYINKSTPLFCFDILDSTMNEIKKKKYNIYNEVAVLANQQTQGRGRRKNSWISDKGNLYLSIRFKKKIENNHHFITYVMGIVLYDIIKKFISKPIKTFIKWPNDIYVDNKKVCGILIEFLSYGNNIKEIIVGIGVNINNNPENLDKTSTFLKKYCNFSIESIKLTKSILIGINSWIEVLNDNKRIILEEWMKRSTKLNSKVKFHHNNKIVKGVYKGLAKDGSIEILMENKKNNFFNLELI
tara:strand:+ start:14991 stop:15725 length:735 start_codon:yes stop_codon:yes gene_type:complete